MTNSTAYVLPGISITPETITGICCNVYGISKDEIHSRSRKDNISQPRGMALFFIFKFLNYSKTKAGLIFKMRETSARYWIINVPEFSKVDREMRLKFIEIGHRLGLLGDQINNYLKGK